MKIGGDTLGRLLRDAQGSGYAIPHFNYSDIWDLLAIVEAAEEERAPVILASVPKVVNEFGPDLCGAIGRTIMERANVPIIHHLDHATEVELCIAAIDNGYPSVLIDGSTRPIADNIRLVREVVKYAHAHNVHVEAEVGKILSSKDEGLPGAGETLADAEEASRLVAESRPDSLAVAIGSSHGFYDRPPLLDIDRLKRIRSKVDIPLVLHGGTGIPPDQVRSAIANGMAKVNVGTIIRHTYLTNLRTALGNMERAAHPVDINRGVRPEIKKVVREWIAICMAAGRA